MMAAPVRSAVETGYKRYLGIKFPAFGSPSLIPPFLAVRGFGDFCIKFAPMTAMALICSPTPWKPSHSVAFQLWPHQVSESPPEHCRAAPIADSRSFGITMSVVQGQSCVVTASHLMVYALKDV